jgi:hypothetical protein
MKFVDFGHKEFSRATTRSVAYQIPSMKKYLESTVKRSAGSSSRNGQS